MRIFKLVTLAIAILLLVSLAHTWFTNSAYMRRPPKVDAREMIPGGLRTIGGASGGSLKIDGYRGAGVRYFRLAQNLDIIISELGLDYLNNLRSLKGSDDEYVEWKESPIDLKTLEIDAPIVSVVLNSLRNECDTNETSKSYCFALKAAEKEKGLYYTYGTGEFVFLHAKPHTLNIAFAGPYTGKR